MVMESTLTKEWSVFDPAKGYEKKMQDIQLKNGDIVRKCWPNAGVWTCFSARDKYYQEYIPSKDVAMVRLTHVKMF